MPMTPGKAARLRNQVEEHTLAVKKLFEIRDQLQAQKTQLEQLRDQLIAQRDQLIIQRDNFRDQRDLARDQRDQAMLVITNVRGILVDPVLTETEKLTAITGAVA